MKRERRWLLALCVFAILCAAFLYLWFNRASIGRTGTANAAAHVCQCESCIMFEKEESQLRKHKRGAAPSLSV